MHLIPGIGRHRLDRLRPEHLDQLYTALLDDSYSPPPCSGTTASCPGPSRSRSSAATSCATSPHSSTHQPSGRATSPPPWT